MDKTKKQIIINQRVIKILNETGKGSGRTQIRIVSWDGREPVLEKRQIIYDKTLGYERPGKVRGFILTEVWDLVRSIDSINHYMKIDARE